MWREDPPGFPNTASSSLRVVGLHPSADRYIGPLPERSPRPESGISTATRLTAHLGLGSIVTLVRSPK